MGVTGDGLATDWLGLPALGLDVMYMGMFARTDIRHDLADIRAVLDYGIARFHGFDCELVPDRNVARGFELDVEVLIHYPTGNLISGLDALDNNYADTISIVVYHKIYHLISPEI